MRLSEVRTIGRVPRRFMTRSDVYLFALIGAVSVLIGTMFLLDRTAVQTVWGGGLWDVLFVLGGLLTLLYAALPSSWRLRAASNAVLVVASAGRGAGLFLAVLKLVGWIRGPAVGISIPRALGGIGVYWLLAVALFVVWRSRIPADGRTRGGS